MTASPNRDTTIGKHLHEVYPVAYKILSSRVLASVDSDSCWCFSSMVNSLLDTSYSSLLSSLLGRSLFFLLSSVLCLLPLWMSLFGERVQPLQSTLLCSVAFGWFTHRTFDE
jgi:hypothetical protein